MVSAVVRTSKLHDGEILGLAEKLFKIMPGSKANISYPAGQTAIIDGSTDFTKLLLNDRDRLIQKMVVSFPGTIQETVSFHREIVDTESWRNNPYSGGFDTTMPDAYFDEVSFLEVKQEHRYGGNQPDPPDKIDRNLVFSILRIVNSYAVDSTYVGQIENAANVSDVVAGQISDLRALNLEMTRGLAEARQDADKQLAVKSASRDKIYAGKEKALADLELDLQKRREELNDREPQHERRRLREHLTERLQTAITNPYQQTGIVERQAYYFYLLAGLVFLSLSVYFSYYTRNETTTYTIALLANPLKGFAAGIAGAAFIWSGLSGLKQSAIAARSYEQTIQRYAFDMDRASWIVETILQMNSVEKNDVPTEWLESVCRDLFTINSKGETENSSLEAFAALFDATARARIGTTGIEFEVDRKGAKKLASG